MPDISVFCFHFWELIEYYDPTAKQPHDGWEKGRFLGIARDSGDGMTYKIEPISNSNRNFKVLIRSTIRSLHEPQTSFLHQNSGETTTSVTEEENEIIYDEDNSNAKNKATDINNQTEINIEEDDALELQEQLNNIARGEEEDFEFHHIHSYKWEDGILIFTVELTSGKALIFHLV